MRSNYYHIALASIFLLISSGDLRGQTQVEVITKTVERSFTLKTGYSIKVEGESAKIQVEGWESNEVKVVIKLVSKSLTKAVAEKELGYQKYTIDEINETHVIKNFLLVPKELKELSSILETDITVFVPSWAQLEVENRFGGTALTKLEGDVKVVSAYGDILLKDVSGNVEVESNFGDLVATSLKGKAELSLTHTETEITGFTGNGIITSNLGDITIRDVGKSSTLKINGLKSDVKVEVSSVENYRWQVKSKYGRLIAPAQLSSKVKSIKNIKLEFGSESSPLIDINTDFGQIEVIEL